MAGPDETLPGASAVPAEHAGAATDASGGTGRGAAFVRLRVIARLARRNAWADRGGLAMCALAIVGAVAFATATRALTAGVAGQLRVDVAAAYTGVDAVVRLPETGRLDDGAADASVPQRPPLPAGTAERVAALPAVQAAEVNLVVPMQLATAANRLLGPVAPERNIGIGWLGQSALNPLRIVAGSPPVSPTDVVVDAATAARGGMHAGDPARLVTPAGTLPVTISGIARYGPAAGLSGRAVIAFSPALVALAGQRAAPTELLVAFTSGVSPAEGLAALHTALGGSGLEVVPGGQWRHEQAAIVAAPLEAAAFFLTLFTYVTVGVAAILIATTFLVVLGRRARQAALLRLVGMTRGMLFGALVGEALIVGTLATVPGAGVGLLAAKIVSERLRGLGIDLPPVTALLSANVLAAPLITGVVVTVLSAAAPARRIAATPPVGALAEATIGEEALTPRRRRWAVTPFLGGIAAVAWGVHRGMPVTFGIGVLELVVALAMAGPGLLAAASTALGARLGPDRGPLTLLSLSAPRRHPGRSFATAAALMVGVGIFSFFAVFVDTAAASAARTTAGSLAGDVIVSGTGVSAANLPDSVPEIVRASEGISRVATVRLARATDPDGRLHGDVQIAGVDEAFFDLWRSGAPDDAWALLHRSGAGPIPALAVAGSGTDRFGGETVRVGFPAGPADVIVVGTLERNLPAGFEPPVLYVDAGRLPTDVPAPVGYVLVDGDGPPADVRERVQQLLAGEPTAVARTGAEFRGVGGVELDQLLSVARLMLVMATILAVIGVGNTMALTVRERRREIALMRAVGAQQRTVRLLVVLEAEALAVVGTLGGIVAGTLLAVGAVRGAPSGQLRTPSLPLPLLAAAGGVALAAVAVAALVPAGRAARTPVLDALAYE